MVLLTLVIGPSASVIASILEIVSWSLPEIGRPVVMRKGGEFNSALDKDKININFKKRDPIINKKTCSVNKVAAGYEIVEIYEL